MSKNVEIFLLTNKKNECKIYNQMEVKKIKYKTIQQWLPIEKVYENGIIKINKNNYIKIIKIIPINYNLKSELEKEAILNSYKIFLKTCNFNIQILIQSNKEDLSKHISNIKKQIKKEKNSELIHISNNYINFIQKTNQEKNSSSKNFYILIKNSNTNNKKEDINYEERAIEELNEKYFKIKECLSRCGNNVIEFEEKEEIQKVIYSFLNANEYLQKEGDKNN